MSALLDRALDAIRAERERARALGIELIGVSGSVARREDTADSDIDILFEVRDWTTLFRLGAVINDLESVLGRRVDLIDRNHIKPLARDGLERDLVAA